MRIGRSLASGCAIAATALLAASCRGRSDPPQAELCPSVAWGGWDGTGECAGLAATVIAGSDRVCAVDQDCAIVGVNACEARSVSTAASSRYQGRPPPCVHPLAGMCLPVAWRASCQQGCCVPAR